MGLPDPFLTHQNRVGVGQPDRYKRVEMIDLSRQWASQRARQLSFFSFAFYIFNNNFVSRVTVGSVIGRMFCAIGVEQRE